MNQHVKHFAFLAACTLLAVPRFAAAQAASEIPPAITTPDTVDSRIGTLDFKDDALKGSNHENNQSPFH